jgi:hypothetical protein
MHGTFTSGLDCLGALDQEGTGSGMRLLSQLGFITLRLLRTSFLDFGSSSLFSNGLKASRAASGMSTR